MLIAVLFPFSSCEDDITFEFSNYEKKIVVEGVINQGEVPNLFLTWSSGYFDTLNINITRVYQLIEEGNFSELEKIFGSYVVSDAFVTVSNGILTDTLTLNLTPLTFPFINYIGSGKIIGEPGYSYTLDIVYHDSINDLNYELFANTSIPEPVPIDSLWFEFRNPDEDSLGYIHGIFDDPQELGNYYRIFSRTEERDIDYVHPWNSVWNDRNINGEENINFQIYHGANTSDDPEDVNRWYFRLDEVVHVRLCAIDYEHFQFWYTYQQNAGGGGNPFASPSQIATNISGGLGIWGGYGIYDTLYIVEHFVHPEIE